MSAVLITGHTGYTALATSSPAMAVTHVISLKPAHYRIFGIYYLQLFFLKKIV